jgi:RecB family exonuclease
MSQVYISNPATKKAIGNWHIFSASKLRQLHECPFAFYQLYFLHQELVWTPWMASGSALHYMFEQFFKKNFKSADSFAGSWGEYWQGLCEGRYSEHGRKPRKNGPLKISFSDSSQIFALQAMGKKIVKRFYADNIGYRNTLFHPEVEVKFNIPFRGYKIRGVIDRIQKIETTSVNDEEIWDYKTHLPKPEKLIDFPQLTWYDPAYRHLKGRLPAGMRIYCYKTGEKTDLVPPRQESDFDQLERWLREAHAYVFGVLFWRHYGFLPNGFTFKDFTFFPTSDIEQGIFRPRYYPDYSPCQSCSLYGNCKAYRDQPDHRPVVEDLLVRLMAAKQEKMLASPGKKETKKQLRAKFEIDLFSSPPLEELSEFIAQRLE